MKRGDNEAGEIKYVHIKKDSQGLEQIEVQGKFITNWLGKRLVLEQIVTTDSPQNILTRIVTENLTSPQSAARKIPNLQIVPISAIDTGVIDYTSESEKSVLYACETVAKAAELGFRIIANIREKRYGFCVYRGSDLTSDQTVSPQRVFSQEHDNVLEQEFINSDENLKTTAYVGGEEKQDVPRKVVEVGDDVSGLDRDEVFIRANDIRQKYKTDGKQVTMTDAEYADMLVQRGVSELERYTETQTFSSKVNIYGNLKYKTDYDLGNVVTCVNKRWGIKVNSRITEVSEVYQDDNEGIEVTFGEALPTLFDKIRNIKG